MLGKRILMTGATGFVGSATLSELLVKGYEVSVLGRTPSGREAKYVPFNLVELGNYSLVLQKNDILLHIAARAHVMVDDSSNPLSVYRRFNTHATINLAQQAAANGIKRFIFISSIKVNGESTGSNEPFTAAHASHTVDPYGISKDEAEKSLRTLASETGMEVVIIRPPLVYGPSVKANFAAMMNLAQKNLPLPLGAIHNKRSLVALDNLVDLITTCIDHPNAANQTFLVSDDRDVSTTELLQMMTRAAGKKSMLLPVPVSWLRLAGKLIGKQAVIERLCGNLQVDITHTKDTLGWKPPISVEEGVRRCFIKEKSA